MGFGVCMSEQRCSLRYLAQARASRPSESCRTLCPSNSRLGESFAFLSEPVSLRRVNLAQARLAGRLFSPFESSRKRGDVEVLSEEDLAQAR